MLEKYANRTAERLQKEGTLVVLSTTWNTGKILVEEYKKYCKDFTVKHPNKKPANRTAFYIIINDKQAERGYKRYAPTTLLKYAQFYEVFPNWEELPQILKNKPSMALELSSLESSL